MGFAHVYETERHDFSLCLEFVLCSEKFFFQFDLPQRKE